METYHEKVKTKKIILFLANHFDTLYTTRKELILRLVKCGHEIYLSLPESEENKYFENMGCNIVLTPIDRRGINPFHDIQLIRFYKKMLSEINPDIIFSYTIKPNIYGCMASNKKYKQVCNITGTGATFLKNDPISAICRILYRMSIKKSYKVFFQNSGDKDYFIAHKMVAENYELLPGSGCNLQEHSFSEMPEEDEIRFIFIGRAMKLKGIDEYLTCAKAISEKYPNTRFYFAGWNEEPRYKEIISEYEKQGYIKNLGFRRDIADWIQKCHCTILCSHGGEGVPNVLLETSAMGRVCIASNVNGSRDVVDDGVTGFLYQSKNADDLIKKVEQFLLLSSVEKSKMGYAGRKKIEQKFDRNIVIQKYIDEVYAS